MSESTQFLAQILGPIILAIGLGLLVSKDYYYKVYRQLQDETLAVFMSGIAGIAAGIAILLYHNEWSTLPEILVSIMGVATLAKGLLLTIAPKFMENLASKLVTNNIMMVGGIIYLLVGIYLSYIAYF